MDEHQHHEELIAGVSKEYKDILEGSGQAIYIYLDDNHKVCNEKFAQLLGFSSAEEFAKTHDPFAQNFVEEESQHTLVSAYTDAMEKMVASQNKIVWKKKTGESVATQVILVPIAHAGHIFALHFVSEL